MSLGPRLVVLSVYEGAYPLLPSYSPSFLPASFHSPIPYHPFSLFVVGVIDPKP